MGVDDTTLRHHLMEENFGEQYLVDETSGLPTLLVWQDLGKHLDHQHYQPA